MKTTRYLFTAYNSAQTAARQLIRSGIASQNITFVASKADGRRPSNGDSATSSGAASGAAVGSVVGIGAGIMAALGVPAIPGLGPLVAAGILATTIVTTTGGVLAGSLIGGLIEYGSDEKNAHVYAQGVRRGGTFISVRSADDQAASVDAIMRRNGGVHAAERRNAYAEGGWSTYDEAIPAYTPKEIERQRPRYQA